MSGDTEFGFAELAKEYFGRVPMPGEAAALALVLHASPMHFYKKGKGRYKAAPIEALQAARAGVERKRRETEEVESYVAELLAHRLPPAFRDKLPMLLYKPDKLALETRALAAACDTARTHPLALLAACGAVPSTHEYHFNRFLFEAFPRGTGFPPIAEIPPIPDLPLAAVRAFSIDDASTTEIDDAFSVRPSRTEISRSVFTSRRLRSASRAARRWMPWRVRGCPPCTCPVARSPCCRKR